MSKLAAVLFFVALLAAGARAQSPDSVKDFHQRGAERYARGDFEGAISDFTAVIDLSSSLLKGGALRGRGTAAAGGADEAFARARVHDPRTASAYLNRGVARLAKDDYDVALQDFDQALSISPGMVWAYYDRGTAWLLKGEVGRALEDYDRTVRLDPR